MIVTPMKECETNGSRRVMQSSKNQSNRLNHYGEVIFKFSGIIGMQAIKS